MPTLFSQPARVLRPYQVKAKEAILNSFYEDKNALTIMATGLGKTIVFSEVFKELIKDNYRPLMIAHRGELLNQAIDKIESQTGITPDKEQANYKATRNAKCVVGSVQTLQRDRLNNWHPDHFDYLTIDEAHHAAATTYQNIINHFNCPLLGVTATPDRADDKHLGDIFDEVVFQYNLSDGIKDGWLSPIVGKKIDDFDIDLNGLKVVAGDYTDSELGNVLENYIAPIATAIKQETEGLKTLSFLPNVKSAMLIAEAMNELGIPAAVLHGKLPKAERAIILNQFSTGKIMHLSSCDILLEGYDEPSIESIIMLRPTTSRSLYSQAVGRGTRLFSGKEHLLLIEFTFNSSRLKLVTPFELFSEKGYGEKVQTQALKMQTDIVNYLDLLEEARKEVYDMKNIISRMAIKKIGFTTFDPFSLGDLLNIDLSGEFDIKFEGRKLEGVITEKQKSLLMRYNINDIECLSKAQASILIDTLFQEPYAFMKGPSTLQQKQLLQRYGVDPQGLTKASASLFITKLKEGAMQKQ